MPLPSLRNTLGSARRFLPLVGAALLAGVVSSAGRSSGQQAAASVFVRTDSDTTTVVTPRLRAQTELAEGTTAELVYVIDVWSSASIDIRTSASKAVTEQRDEIDVLLGQEFEDLRLRGGYVYSTEPDYESHTALIGAELDLAERSTTLAAGGFVRFDTVGRAGDPGFERDTRAAGATAALTQVLDRASLVQITYEVAGASGYLSSPYRYVGVGGDGGTCRGQVLYCVPETNPEARLRHAVALRGRRALSSALSAGLGYRFYTDDWALHSHTAQADVAWLAATNTTLGARYRFYWQSAADHYEARYLEEREDGLYTRDKELSPLHNHGAAIDLEQRWPLGGEGVLRTLLSFGPTLYEYRDFVGLEQITAFDVTLAMVFEL
jgi:hypothetical protein